MITNPTQPAIHVTRGDYVGNAAIDRGIPHGLGGTPTTVIIQCTDALSSYELFHIVRGVGRIYVQYAGQSNARNVSALDDTNFYVGDNADFSESANEVAPGAWSYSWIAILES